MIKLTDLKRKNPVQKRSQETVETIFEATAQLLEGEQGGRVSTNKIARKAGFSIGTLYQYFPNKDSLLVAMAYHERNRVKVVIEKALQDIDDAPLEESVRKVVRALMGAFQGRTRLRKHLMLAIFQTGNFAPFMQAQDEILNFILEAMKKAGGDRVRTPNDTMGYVMSRSMMGVIRNAVMEDTPRWKDPAFEDELVRLLYHYIRV